MSFTTAHFVTISYTVFKLYGFKWSFRDIVEFLGYSWHLLIFRIRIWIAYIIFGIQVIHSRSLRQEVIYG